MNKTVEDFYPIATGMYLAESYTYKEFQKASDEDIEYSLWEPLMYVELDEIYNCINGAADDLFRAYKEGFEEGAN